MKKVQFIVLMIVCLLILPKPVLAEKFEISGVLEAESFYSSTDLAAGGDTNASDITTATAELAVGMNLHQYVHGQINLKWEEDDTDPLQFDVGTMTLGKLDGLSVTVGKAYLPFGAFNSHFVSDPITLQLGETRESPFIIAYNQDIFTVKAGAFNGDVCVGAKLWDTSQCGNEVCDLAVMGYGEYGHAVCVRHVEMKRRIAACLRQ